MKVNEDGKLTLILQKILPSLLEIYIERDLVNANVDHPKVKAVEELMNQLTNRMENSRGGIKVPINQIIAVFVKKEFLDFENQLLRRVLIERIHRFIKATLEFSVNQIDDPQSMLDNMMLCLRAQQLPIIEKIRIFIIAAYYSLQTDSKALHNAIQKDKEVFLQYVLLFTISVVACPNHNWQSNLKPLFLGQIKLYYKNDGKVSELQHQQQFENLLLSTLLQSRTLFTPQQTVPILLVATSDVQACSNGVRELCMTYLRSIQVDLADANLERALLMILGKKYDFYSDCAITEGMISEPPTIALKYLISWLMKLETQSQGFDRFQVVKMCLNSQDMHQTGLNLLRHLIRTDPCLSESAIIVYKEALQSVVQDNKFNQQSQSMALLMLAELGEKNYELVLKNNTKYALMTFERLKSRIDEVHNFINIREDEISLTLMEALNKLRDCFEQNLEKSQERTQLVDQIVEFMHSPEARDVRNSELIYILYLYLAKLDQDQTSAALLLHSVNLKDHPDIKIRKEVGNQLEKFEQQSESKQRGLLAPFLNSLRLLFISEQNPIYRLVTDADAQIKQSYDNNLSQRCTIQLIDKILELSSYALRFYKHDLCNQSDVERLLLLNLNMNFTNLKSDFVRPLKMINRYLKLTQKPSDNVLLTTDACQLITSIGINISSLDQKIASLQILDKIYSLKQNCFENQVVDVTVKTHEQRLTAMMGLTLSIKFGGQDLTKFLSIAEQVCQQNNPNSVEEQKLLAHCIAILPFCPKFDSTIDTFIKNVLNRQLDNNTVSGYKARVLRCLPSMCKQNQDLSQKTQDQLAGLVDFDNYDVQLAVGKCLSKIWSDQKMIIQKLKFLIQQCQRSSLELNQKRNSVIYIFQLVNMFAASVSEIRDDFVDIQQVFMRFLFDRRSQMQDLASKGLSLVYKLGDENQRQMLITSLQHAFSGQQVQKKEQDENQELLLDFNDSTSQEQRDKLKTYKDLVRVAEELGQKDLIYQFLEVHRHNQRQQDIKNVAKGMTGLLMLDDQIKQSLIKITPKILLLTYDHNQEVKDTMIQLWAALISADQETKVINQRWSEIYEECFKAIKGDQWRNKQSACLCLSDLVLGQNRTWQELQVHYREVFLTSLGLLNSDVKESVQKAAYKLIKALRSFTLKFSNLYSNTNIKELQEVIDILVPMVLDDCLVSQIQKVRLFGLHMLAELIRSTQSQNLAEKLKINNKWERQLTLTSNSPQQMSALLNNKGYLPRIITEMILNVSMLGDKTTVQLNYAEQMAADGKLKIAESELSDLRMKYSRESLNGEILKICRVQLMTSETFDEVLNTLVQVIQKGNYDQLTKQTAVSFIIDTVLESISLIKPQSSKKIATKIVQMYTQLTPAAAIQIKDTLKQMYASCLGLQFKILREFPNTVQQILDQIADLDSQLALIKTQNFHEIQKQLPSQFLENPNTSSKFLPFIFVNKFNDSDEKLQKMSERAWDHHVEILKGAQTVGKLHGVSIMTAITAAFDSQSYADRVSATVALQAFIPLTNDDESVNKAVEKIVGVVCGKYFEGKKKIVKVLTDMIQQQLIDPPQNYIQDIFPQIQNQKLDHEYRNNLLQSLKPCQQLKHHKQIFDFLMQWLEQSLSQVVTNSQASLLAEQNGQFFDFDTKKDDERQLLATVVNIYDLMTVLVNTETITLLDQLTQQYYGKTNWMVRKCVLECYNKIKVQGTFGMYLINQVAECGEKYERNLILVSEITLKTLSSTKEVPQQIKNCALKIVQALMERKQEELKRNTDLIRQLCQ